MPAMGNEQKRARYLQAAVIGVVATSPRQLPQRVPVKGGPTLTEPRKKHHNQL